MTLPAGFARIDGQIVAVVPAVNGLPRRLDALLDGLRLSERHELPPIGGMATPCRDGEHRLLLWLSGLYGARQLRLSQCRDCGTVEVRDVSFDRLSGAPQPRLYRRNALLGWYTGRRPAGRIYT